MTSIAADDASPITRTSRHVAAGAAVIAGAPLEADGVDMTSWVGEEVLLGAALTVGLAVRDITAVCARWQIYIT
eukprot:1614911-Pyramimonas_sp.AAC.1